MKKVSTVILTAVLTVFLTFTVSAQVYDMEYPDVYNSGSPYWIECTIQGLGNYVIVLDPRMDPRSFGFDGPNGYNLINNTSSTINGRAYDLDSSLAYNVRWQSFYKLQVQNGTTQYNQPSWQDYNITSITGTTLDLIDYHGDRGNDYYEGLPVEYRDFALVTLCIGVVVALIYRFLRRNRNGWC